MTRGVPARFASGLLFTGDPLPVAHCDSERDFQVQLRAGTWNRALGSAAVLVGPYDRFGYRQGAISEPGLTSTEPVLVNDSTVVDPSARGLLTTACYGFAPSDPTHPTAPSDPSQTIATFQAANHTVQEAIDYFGEWFGLGSTYFQTQYAAHGITAPHETCQSAGATPSSVLIPGSTDFAFAANTSFTVEAFIKPDSITDDYVRAIAASRSSGLRSGEPNANEAGWALCLGPYRSIPNNLRWVLGDATGNLVTVDANVNLADGEFHHVAGVVDRDVGVAILFVDGVEVNQTPLGNLGVAATNGDIILGNSPALSNSPVLSTPYAGLIDEVRISSTARRLFQPVLGESDDRYRQRLAIFQPCACPTTTPSFAACRRSHSATRRRSTSRNSCWVRPDSLRACAARRGRDRQHAVRRFDVAPRHPRGTHARPEHLRRRHDPRHRAGCDGPREPAVQLPGALE